jgi:hypothetical protein
MVGTTVINLSGPETKQDMGMDLTPSGEVEGFSFAMQGACVGRVGKMRRTPHASSCIDCRSSVFSPSPGHSSTLVLSSPPGALPRQKTSASPLSSTSNTHTNLELGRADS